MLGIPLGGSLVFRGWARSRLHQPEAGLSELRDGLAKMHATGAGTSVGYMTMLLGQTLAVTDAYTEAATTYDEALDVVRRTGERLWESEIHRLMGDLIVMQGDSDDQRAAAHFHDAIEVARAQDAKSLELRAATSLARLWRDQGKPVEARHLLASVYGWFTEGFDTPDLRDAKALIDELN